MVGTANVQPGVFFAQMGGGRFRYARLAAKQVETVTALPQAIAQVVGKVDAGDLFLQRRAENFRAEHGTGAIGNDQPSTIEERLIGGIFLRIMQDFCIWSHTEALPAVIQQGLRLVQRLCQRHIVKCDAHYVYFQ